jgi:hypothetical protein
MDFDQWRGTEGRAMTLGDKLKWTSGAVGLTGILCDIVHIPHAPRKDAVLYAIETEHGILHEHPGNVTAIVRPEATHAFGHRS